MRLRGVSRILAVFGDHQRSISKDTLQFERVFASRFVPRRIFGPRVWGDTNLLRHTVSSSAGGSASKIIACAWNAISMHRSASSC